MCAPGRAPGPERQSERMGPSDRMQCTSTCRCIAMHQNHTECGLDAAGSRAALRGIDLILSQGMNVKICNLPENEDPDSFVSERSLKEVESYLLENSKDFIVYKASLLLSDTQNDPVKKAGVIRDMVESISKISDQIKRELYIKECSSIMDISEQVLYLSLIHISEPTRPY